MYWQGDQFLVSLYMIVVDASAAYRISALRNGVYPQRGPQTSSGEAMRMSFPVWKFTGLSFLPFNCMCIVRLVGLSGAYSLGNFVGGTAWYVASTIVEISPTLEHR